MHATSVMHARPFGAVLFRVCAGPPLRHVPAFKATHRVHGPRNTKRRLSWTHHAGPPRAIPSQGLGVADVVALDELIDHLTAARASGSFPEAVAKNLLSFDRGFWLRLAARRDTASSEAEAESLTQLASDVMLLVDEMVKESESQVQRSSRLLQRVLEAGADGDSGQWQLPLSTDKRQAMRGVMAAHSTQLDEAFVTSAMAWIRKSESDSIEGMALLLRKVLQMFAGCSLLDIQPGGQGRPGVMDAFLEADEEQWTSMLQDMAGKQGSSGAELLQGIQVMMEHVALQGAAGSQAQRVQIEYLNELKTRALNAFSNAQGTDDAGAT
ncbi:BAF3 [Auxenochlorella protothecoides x Auxenochlorella symbiontica]